MKRREGVEARVFYMRLNKEKRLNFYNKHIPYLQMMLLQPSPLSRLTFLLSATTLPDEHFLLLQMLVKFFCSDSM